MKRLTTAWPHMARETLDGFHLCSFNSSPAPQPLQPLPTPEDPAIAERKRREREAAKNRKGRGSTIITGGLGDPGEAPVQRPTLLGGA